MNIQFETSQIGQAEAQGLISLLSSLFPTASVTTTYAAKPSNVPQPSPQPPSPKNEKESIFGVPVQVETGLPVGAWSTNLAIDPAPARPEPTPITSKRTRRTKAEIAADEAAAKQAAQAPTGPTTASAAPNAEVSGTTQSATATTGTVSADELRALLNGYIAKHSMEEAIGQLKTFGCNRVTEALALEPAKLNALAEALRG